MIVRAPVRDWRTSLRRLHVGNRRYVRGEATCGVDGGRGVVAAVVIPENWSLPPWRLFDIAPEDLHVVQGDLTEPSFDVLAGVEWAAVAGARLAVVFGDSALCEELEVQLAPHGVAIVEAVLGPEGRVRFAPQPTVCIPVSRFC